MSRPVLYSDHEPFTPDPYYGWMDQGVSWRNLWIAELDQIAAEDLPALAQVRLNNGESCEITAHEADSQRPPLRDLLAGLELGKAVMEAFRLNESGNCEIHLLNPGNDTVEVSLPGFWKKQLPPHSLKIYTWKRPENG